MNSKSYLDSEHKLSADRAEAAEEYFVAAVVVDLAVVQSDSDLGPEHFQVVLDLLAFEIDWSAIERLAELASMAHLVFELCMADLELEKMAAFESDFVLAERSEAVEHFVELVEFVAVAAFVGPFEARCCSSAGVPTFEALVHLVATHVAAKSQSNIHD